MLFFFAGLDYMASWSVSSRKKNGDRYILVCSKKRSSVFSASKVSFSSSPLLSSASDSSTPIGLAWKVVEALGAAKLVKPLGVAAAAKPPPTPEKPLPMAPNPVGPAVDLKLVVPEVVGLKTDELDVAPSVPKGDFSDPAKAAMLEVANEEVEVVSSFPARFFPMEAKGEEVQVLANALEANA